MGRKSSRKVNDKKVKKRVSDYEGFRFGPLIIERFGRYIKYSSKWKPGEHKEHMKYIRKNRPEFRKEIDRKITEILTLINTYDPLRLIFPISLNNCFFDPEGYTEITHEGRETFVEYALSLILSQERKNEHQDATKEAVDRFGELIQDILNSVLWYFASEAAEKKHEKIKEQVRFISLMRYLYLRGDSFQEHHIELWQEIFNEHDEFFKAHYGLSSSQVFQGIQEIENQILMNIRASGEFTSILHEMHEVFKEFIDKEGIDSFSSIEDSRERFHALPPVQEKQQELDKVYQMVSKNPFEIQPNERCTTKLLDLMSTSFGENKSFAEFIKAPAWPTNDSIIYIKPIIKDLGKYYCYMPQLIFRNIGNILESWILEKDKDYYLNVFSRKRGKYLERKTLDYLKTIFPDARVYSGLKYYQKDGAVDDGETDGLILYDDNMFLIEAKAGSLSLSARRGGLDRMKKDAAELIDEAYKQALRAKSYIMQSDEPAFYNPDGSLALTLKNKEFYKNIYLINVTLSGLGHLSTQLNSLKAFGLLEDKEWPWSVFINDLRVISELVEFPSQFLLFLQRRIRANDYPQFRTSDELDFFMFYFLNFACSRNKFHELEIKANRRKCLIFVI